MSPGYHELISQRDDLQWIRDVTEEVQKKILAEFGYDRPEGRMALNYARYQYKEDPEMNQITVYQRQDRSTEGTLVVGCALPYTMLSTLEGEEISLHDYIKKIQGNSGRPLVITAGSIT